jgi:inner membrane protein
MDSFTHIAIGACMGEALAGKKLGRKAMLWGALAHSLPDADTVTVLWMDLPGSLLAHRGFMHSFLFCILVAPLLAWSATRWQGKRAMGFWKWVSFFAILIFVHIFIDAFNNYGVGWLEPFSHARISFNTLYVVDPFFSIVPIAAAIALVFGRGHASVRKWSWRLGLGISMLYLGYSIINKWAINNDVKKALDERKISYSRYFTTPAPLQNWLWFVVAGNDSGYHVGYRSVFDSRKDISFSYFPRNNSLIDSLKDDNDLRTLIRFSQQFYTIEKWGDTLVLNDLRFGQVAGWSDPAQHFAFHYFLNKDYNNSTVVQRGRLATWNREGLKSLITRIKGN